MKRPETPALKRGDTLMMYSGTPGRRDGGSWSEVRVVTVGTKYVHVVAAGVYAEPLPEKDRWRLRKFLLSDMHEGEPGRRVGYSASLATAEQQAYDAMTDRCRALVRDRAGLDIRHGSPFGVRKHPERLIALADAIAPLLDEFGAELQ